MQWYHVVSLVLGNAALIIPLFLWNRGEANTDRREIISLMHGIQEEIKDFHGRLCALEEKYHQIRK